jgi:glycosidase
LANDFAEGVAVLQQAAAAVTGARATALRSAATVLAAPTPDLGPRVTPALDAASLLWHHPVREHVVASPTYQIWVDRPRALFSAWYEFFPRSEAGAEPPADPSGAPSAAAAPDAPAAAPDFPPAAPDSPAAALDSAAAEPPSPAAATILPAVPPADAPVSAEAATVLPAVPPADAPVSAATEPVSAAAPVTPAGAPVAALASAAPAPASAAAVTRPVPTEPRHGTFATAAQRLPAIARMGFDIVYLPPIHPIGRVNRKGRNNAVVARPGDVGSPWAIGASEGGHDAIHPQLGTDADLRAFVAAASAVGLDVALDLALQCAPDHPWVTEHPQWFTAKPDGSIAYAENPPKKYQDIYPLNFDNDPDGIRAEVLRVVMHWVDRGIKIFRVDNPHTKPLDFWAWLIWEVKQRDPDVLFLAEAFTRPAMMHGLAALGFTQSYTYFTWRNSPYELRQYCEELVASAHYMRPNFWPNTPDILHETLQHGGPTMFKIRAILASMLSPSWGMYSGYELYEHLGVAGSEEYRDSEKYQLRPRDWAGAAAAGRSLAPFITKLNAIRRANPALHWLSNLRFHDIDNGEVMCFSKRDPHSDNTILVVCSFDPVRGHWANTTLDMPALGLDWHERFTVRDELTGAEFDWGQHNSVRLDPRAEPAHIFTVHRRG